MSSSLQGFGGEKNLNSRRSEKKMKVWESPFIPSHLTFKSFEFTHFKTMNRTINQIYLFVYNIPKFRILGCYKPTTLKMNLVLEIRRGQQEIGQGRGLLKIHRSSPGVWGATTLRNMVTVPCKLIYSILILDGAGLLKFPGKFLLYALLVVP